MPITFVGTQWKFASDLCVSAQYERLHTFLYEPFFIGLYLVSVSDSVNTPQYQGNFVRIKETWEEISVTYILDEHMDFITNLILSVFQRFTFRDAFRFYHAAEYREVPYRINEKKKKTLVMISFVYWPLRLWSERRFQPEVKPTTEHQRQRWNNSVMTLAIPFSWISMESLQIVVATHFLRTVSLASLQSCRSVNTDDWCKRALTFLASVGVSTFVTKKFREHNT